MKTADLKVGEHYAYRTGTRFGLAERVEVLETGVSGYNARDGWYRHESNVKGVLVRHLNHKGEALENYHDSIVLPVTLRATWADYEAHREAARQERLRQSELAQERRRITGDAADELRDALVGHAVARVYDDTAQVHVVLRPDQAVRLAALLDRATDAEW